MIRGAGILLGAMRREIEDEERGGRGGERLPRWKVRRILRPSGKLRKEVENLRKMREMN